MQSISVSTFQHVKLNLYIGILGWRILAFVIDFLLLFLRWLFRMVNIYPFFILMLFFGQYGFTGSSLVEIPVVFSIAVTKQGQRLGDIIARTTVVKIRKKNRPNL